MARIRTIKPEFPQSESMGRVSRDARLLFVMLWPICDDHGRTRAASRMLASLLFPYDDDAPCLIDGWLDELEREGCITRYAVNGSTFLQVTNWLIHQKIDKPSKPQFPEIPGTLARIREDSSEEGKGKEGKGEEEKHCGSADAEPPPPNKSNAIPYQAIVDAYNQRMTRLSKVQLINAPRKTAIRRAWESLPSEHRQLGAFKAIFAECELDDFLNGTGPYSGDHANWRPDFDHLIKIKTITKVYEKAMARRERARLSQAAAKGTDA